MARTQSQRGLEWLHLRTAVCHMGILILGAIGVSPQKASQDISLQPRLPPPSHLA